MNIDGGDIPSFYGAVKLLDSSVKITRDNNKLLLLKADGPGNNAGTGGIEEMIPVLVLIIFSYHLHNINICDYPWVIGEFISTVKLHCDTKVILTLAGQIYKHLSNY